VSERHERDVISDEMWAVIEPLLPRSQGAGRPWSAHRLTVEGVAWRFRTGAPWRDLPERFGKWNTVYKTFDRWASDGTWQRILTAVQARSDAAGDLDWVAAVDSTITRVHQHGANMRRSSSSSSLTGGSIELQRSGSRTG
jgi:transposase